MEEKAKLEKEKIELEIQKLQRDLSSNFEEQKILGDKEKHQKDHRRSMLALWLSIISPIITIISLVITFWSLQSNVIINEETLRQKKLERVDKLKSEFDNVNTQRERKSSIAYELMADSTLLSKYDRDRYAAFYNSFYAAVTQKEEKSSSLNQQIESKSKGITKQEIEKLNEAEKKQVNLENKLAYTTTTNQALEIKNELKAITEDMNAAGPAIKLLDTLSSNQKDLTKLQKESSIVQPEVTWFKEGYYRPFEDIIIALVQLNVNKGTGTVRVSKILGENNSMELYTISFNIPGKKTFIYNKNTYEIDFIKIDRAGKNPFTKAVYFSILNLGTKRVFDNTFDEAFN